MGGASTVILSGGGTSIEALPGAFSRAMGKAASKNMGYTMAKELEPFNVHVCTVTLAGSIAHGNSVNPDEVAEAYLAIHQQPAGSWDREWVYHGKDNVEKKPYPKDPINVRAGPGYINQPKVAYHDREEILKKIGAAKL